jgi:hypothetical protein
MVCLVPDLPSFFEAIAAWDEHTYFPILLEDPAWVLPFLRSFRPARVVRFASSQLAGPGHRDEAADQADPGADRKRWSQALQAVGQAWRSEASAGSQPTGNLGGLTRSAAGDPLPEGLGQTPPGLVLSEPGSPMLAGAVALAAGRFQPLVWFDLGADGAPGQSRESGLTRRSLSSRDARAFARQVQQRAEEVAGRIDQLGDACDFLTLAGVWPDRYEFEFGPAAARGERALDDLIGRLLPPEVAAMGEAPDRWAYVGRLLGDPAASLYRAMAALFLQPESALLWNTYGGGLPWSNYEMTRAQEILEPLVPGTAEHRGGNTANLASWHQQNGRSSPYGLFLLNSSGGPRHFSIPGGPGRPGDIPPGSPAAVLMIHSFSAADPTDARTIAGRWLSLGAFAYYGSLNEPFLQAFRPPILVAQLLAAGVPIAAAVRQEAGEPHGNPWRLLYLGDPLFRFEPGFAPRALRVEPAGWLVQHDVHLDFRAVERPSSHDRPSPDVGTTAEADLKRLDRCWDDAIVETTSRPSPAGISPLPGRDQTEGQPLDWRTLLTKVHRERLPASRQPFWDALAIACWTDEWPLTRPQAAIDDRPQQVDASDTGSDGGSSDRPQRATFSPWTLRLARIAPGAWSPQVEGVLEYETTTRLMESLATNDLEAALNVWDEAIRWPRPVGSEFPSQLSERLGDAADTPSRLMTWVGHLKRAEAELRADPRRSHHAGAPAAERRRTIERLGPGQDPIPNEGERR